MKIYYWLYQNEFANQLNAQTTGSRHPGALLKIEGLKNEVQQADYLDIHPWPELGQKSLSEQLSFYKCLYQNTLSGQPSELQNNSSNFKLNPQNWWEDLSCTNGLQIRNNLLITDWRSVDRDVLKNFLARGGTHIKVKLYPAHANDFINWHNKILDLPILWRWDANVGFNPKSFETFLRQISDKMLHRIEYIEDPFLLDESLWTTWNQKIPLAADQVLKEHSTLSDSVWDCFSAIIIKPDPKSWKSWALAAQKNNKKITVTSSMGHIVGDMYSLWVAQQVDQLLQTPQVHGCWTYWIFNSDPVLKKWFQSCWVESYFKGVKDFKPFLNYLQLLPWKTLTHFDPMLLEKSELDQ